MFISILILFPIPDFLTIKPNITATPTVDHFDGIKAPLVFEFTIRNNKLWAQMIPKEYELGELTPDKKQPTLFRKTTVHGEHWVFEFIKGPEQEPAGCKFIDEDLGLEVVGVRI